MSDLWREQQEAGAAPSVREIDAHIAEPERLVEADRLVPAIAAPAQQGHRMSLTSAVIATGCAM